MKKLIPLFFITSCMFFSSCELITAMLPGTRPTNNIGDSITVSLIPEKKNYMDNDTQQKRIHYEESYPIEEEITLSISGCIDKTIYSDTHFSKEMILHSCFTALRKFYRRHRLRREQKKSFLLPGSEIGSLLRFAGGCRRLCRG